MIVQSVLVNNEPSQKGVTTLALETMIELRLHLWSENQICCLALGISLLKWDLWFVGVFEAKKHWNLPFFVSDAIRGYFCRVCVCSVYFYFPLCYNLKKYGHEKAWRSRRCIGFTLKMNDGHSCKNTPAFVFTRCLQWWAAASLALAEPSLSPPPPLLMCLLITHLSWLLPVLCPGLGTWPGSPLALSGPSSPSLLLVAPLFYIHLSFSSLTVSSQN